MGRLVFIALLAGLLYTAVAFILLRHLVDHVLRHVRPDRLPEKRSRPIHRRIEFAILAIAGVGLLMLGWSYVEPHWLQVEEVSVQIETIAGPDPVRIVQISDLHCDPLVRTEDELPGRIAALRPDLIVFTGDAINHPEGLTIFRSCMSGLSKIAPTFAVRGNWDVWWFDRLDLFGGTGVIVLDGEAQTLPIRGSTITVAGVPVDSEDRIADLAHGAPHGSVRILLHHYPAAGEFAAAAGFDLHLAGDTHGGQVRLPLLGPLVRIYRGGIWRDIGLARVGRMWQYVNRGIGMEGGIAPRVRFMCRPEITVLNLQPGQPVNR